MRVYAAFSARIRPKQEGTLTKAAVNLAWLRIYFFGRFRVELEGEPVRLPTRETRLLLAFLALHPESHARERLAARFWPEVPDPSARASLRNALSTLRRMLGQDLLIADRESVQLNPDVPIWVDALAFREQATDFLHAPSPDPGAVSVELYADDLLVDFYDDWVLAQREFLRELYLKILLELAQQMRSQSEYERAIEFAERILACDRANERAYQHLMFCHVALGNRAVALREYQACREALEDELAVKPSTATEQLHEWIRQATAERLPVEASITNLPIPVTSFIGRRQEMTAAKEAFDFTRMVTLTGAGGSGKTRLAIQLGTDLLDRYADGVWWVELAALSEAEHLPRLIAKALAVPEVPNQPVGETLARFLRTRHLLLVLDNCEHMVGACAQLAERLLGQCPRLSILATSRERLGIVGEHVRAIPTLSTPDPGQALPAERLLKYEAVQLFVRRATAATPEFTLNEENASAVADLCCRLDGLPLAIELAAARTNVLTVDQIVTRLDDALDLITGGRRTALLHHQTLRAAIEWSVNLLSEREQALLCRLSVFAGGWTLPAAEAVCVGGTIEESGVVELLSHLADKSLVEVLARGEERRFYLLETIRQYAGERLLESGDFAAVRTRHLRYFKRLVEMAGAYLGFFLPDAKMDEWLGRLEAEQENLRSAVHWSLQAESTGDEELDALSEAGLRLLSLQHAFLFARGRFSEERAWLERLLERDADVRLSTRAQALVTAGYLACWQGDFTAGRPCLEEALAHYRQFNDASGTALATHGLGFVSLGEGDAAASRPLFEEALRVATETNDKWIMSFAQHFLAIVVTYQGAYDEAQALFEEGNELIRAMGGHRQALAFSLFHLGRIARLQGHFPTARSRHEEAMRLFREGGDRRGIGYSLAGFVALASAEGDVERAARLSGAVASVEAVLGSFLEAPLQAEYDRELAAVRESLDEAAFDTAESEGRAMRMEQAIEYALTASG